MTEIVAVDIGGTHARFAIAEVGGGKVASLDQPCTLKTSEYASLQTAWEAFGRELDRDLPKAVAIAIAGPVQGEILKLTNNSWVIQPALIPERLHVEDYQLVNDFGAVAHAVGQLSDEHFMHLCGDDVPLARSNVISILGPGTGLGVAQLIRADGNYRVIETEGGHVDFAPHDQLEDAMLDQLRESYRRVSVERIVSGIGLMNIYKVMATIEGRSPAFTDERELWTAALGNRDSLASAALDRFCLVLGAFAGDIALAHGADGVVIGGGLGLRLADYLPRSGFKSRFIDKGRFERRMDHIPVKLITHPQPGLYGAAAAFANRAKNGKLAN